MLAILCTTDCDGNSTLNGVFYETSLLKFYVSSYSGTSVRCSKARGTAYPITKIVPLRHRRDIRACITKPDIGTRTSQDGALIMVMAFRLDGVVRYRAWTAGGPLAKKSSGGIGSRNESTCAALWTAFEAGRVLSGLKWC